MEYLQNFTGQAGWAQINGRDDIPIPLKVERVQASLALLLSRNLSRILNRRKAGLYQTVKKWLSEDVYDTRRFEEAYGFQTKTSLEKGLKREVAWYRHKEVPLTDLGPI